MQIVLDDNNIITGYAKVGKLEGGVSFYGHFPAELGVGTHKWIDDESGNCSIFKPVESVTDEGETVVADTMINGYIVPNDYYIAPKIAPAKTLEDRVAKLEAMVERMSYSLKRISESVTEVVKVDNAEMPSGDYLNPIRYIGGMDVEVGKFYTDGEDVWECVKGGTPDGFGDKAFFEVIE